MEKLEFNESQLGKIITDGTGFESHIHDFIDSDGEELVFKKFKDDMPPIKIKRKVVINGKESEEITLIDYYKNKEKKLEILSGLNDPSIVQVRNLYMRDGRIVGYTMPKLEGRKVDLYDKRKEKINHLEQVKKTILRLNAQGIYVGDFDYKNFIQLPDGKTINIDIDNYRIIKDNGEVLNFDSSTVYTREFDESGCDRTLIDRYCYNIYLIALMQKYCLGCYSLYDVKLSLRLRTKENIRTLEEMHILDPNTYEGKLLEFKKKN